MHMSGRATRTMIYFACVSVATSVGAPSIGVRGVPYSGVPYKGQVGQLLARGGDPSGGVAWRVGNGHRDGMACVGSRPQISDPAVQSIPVGFQPAAIAVDAQTRRAFVVNRYGVVGRGLAAHVTVTVLNVATGTVLHTRALPIEGYTTVPGPQAIALDEQTNRVFILTNVRHVDAARGLTTNVGVVSTLDATTGAVLRTVRLARPVVAVAVDESSTRVFVLTAATIPDDGDLISRSPGGHGSVSVLDAASGTVLKAVSVGDAPDALALDERSGRVFVANLGPLDVDTGVPSGAGSVSMLDATSGVVLRTVAVGVFPAGLAVDVRSGRVFVLNLGTKTGLRYAPGPRRSEVSTLDATTGTPVRTTAVGNASGQIGVAATNDRVFIETQRGIILLDATSGGHIPASDHALGPGLPTNGGILTIDDRRGRVVVVIPDADIGSGSTPKAGRAVVLNEHSGATLLSHPVGITPETAMLDERTGQLFVVNVFALCAANVLGSPPGSVSVFTIATR